MRQIVCFSRKALAAGACHVAHNHRLPQVRVLRQRSIGRREIGTVAASVYACSNSEQEKPTILLFGLASAKSTKTIQAKALSFKSLTTPLPLKAVTRVP
jgi:hypothetical protein